MKTHRKILRSIFFISMLILLFALSPPSLFAMPNTQPNENFSLRHFPPDKEQDNLRIHMVQPTPIPLTPTPTMTPTPTPIPAVSNASTNSGCNSITQSGTISNANCQTQSQSQNQVQNNNQNVTVSTLQAAQSPQPMQQVLAAQTVAPPPQNIQQLPSTGGGGQLLFGLISLIPIGIQLKKIH